MKTFLTECTHPTNKQTCAAFNIQAHSYEEAEQLAMAVEDWLEKMNLPRTGLRVVGTLQEVVELPHKN